MKNLNRLLAGAALVLASALPIFGQAYYPDATLIGGTNTTIGLVTNTYTVASGARIVDSRIVFVQASVSSMTSSGSTNFTWFFDVDLSADGSTWTQVARFPVIATASSTGPWTGATNLDTGGASFSRVHFIESTNIVTGTNIAVNWGRKRNL